MAKDKQNNVEKKDVKNNVKENKKSYFKEFKSISICRIRYFIN